MTTVVNIQGVLPIGSTILYQPSVGQVGSVVSIRVYNANAYDFALRKYQDSTATTIDLYSMTLNAGDTLTDSYQYKLDPNDYIEATTTVANTNYLIIVHLTT